MLASSSEFLGLARVRACLYRLKRYPGIRLETDVNTWIPGEIYRFKDVRLLNALDRYEGPEFARVVAEVVLPNGSRLSCWIYQLKDTPE